MAEQKIDAPHAVQRHARSSTSRTSVGAAASGCSRASIPVEGEPFFVCPAFEEGRAREQIALGPFTGTADVRTWHEHESPYALVAAGLRDRGIATGRLGHRGDRQVRVQ